MFRLCLLILETTPSCSHPSHLMHVLHFIRSDNRPHIRFISLVHSHWPPTSVTGAYTLVSLRRSSIARQLGSLMPQKYIFRAKRPCQPVSKKGELGNRGLVSPRISWCGTDYSVYFTGQIARYYFQLMLQELVEIDALTSDSKICFTIFNYIYFVFWSIKINFRCIALALPNIICCIIGNAWINLPSLNAKFRMNTKRNMQADWLFTGLTCWWLELWIVLTTSSILYSSPITVWA
jgi:hypothetical protein